MANKIVFLLVLCAFSAYSAVNFPYPQESSYGNGAAIVTTSGASAALKSKFTSFMSTHYEENQDKTLGRIKFDNTSQTVSEGIGYGMIMMVYFSDNTKSYQAEFDRLWAYYNRFLNQNGLMHWRINGFTTVDGQNAATDAEFDVALALVMAHYQFGGQKYLDDAKSLIGKIRQFEFDPNNLHRPGDNWNSKRNPSYVSPAAFEIFKEVETGQASKWSEFITANYTLLKNNQNQSTGLPSDWCNDNGNPMDNFSYDASRAPWRWAWANAWYGHADAKTLLGKLAPWVNNQTPANVKGSIQLNGTMGGDHNSTFVGPLTNALSYSSTYQNKLNDFWSTLINLNEASYFNKAMQLLTGLFATGNMPNLKALSEVQPSSSSAAPSSSSVGSSSSVTEPDNSSSSDDDGGEDPILVLPKVALLNSAVASKNGINLAVKSNAVVEVFGLKGNSMRKFSFANGVYSVSFSDLPKGLYIVKVSFGNEKMILRVPVK
ncbi:MAG: T9SS type A sorting domain-containing protein [Fibromonadaceae bacterium]|jgi:endo-1,4-beta-D-glucanase Y|nr:T9SS type A sorting domain-containing protein [Fibromonadaceae bacterium]